MTNGETYDANVRVRDLPRDVDQTLNKIATMRGVYRWEIVREALSEFAERHKHEVLGTT